MRRLTLAQRVGLAASASVLVVLAAHVVLTGRATSAQVAAWEREEAAAVAHHVADMMETTLPADMAKAVAGTAADLRPFGIDLAFSTTGRPTDGRSVSVPLKDNRGFIVARATKDLSRTLRARLRRSSLLLALGVLAALLVAVEWAVYWGAVLPLRRIQNQLDRMSRGPWHIDAEVGGGKEVADLSRHIAAVGAQLEQSITQWVDAERRAVAERCRLELRREAIPIVRQLNLEASNLGAHGALSAEGTRAVRRILGAADRLVALVDTAIEPHHTALASGRPEGLVEPHASEPERSRHAR